MLTDIVSLTESERKDLRQEILNNKKSLKTVLDSIDDSLYLHDKVGNIVISNEYFCKSLNYSRDELMSIRIPDLYVNQQAISFSSDMDEIKEQGWLYRDVMMVTKTGKTIEFENKSRTITIDNKELILTVSRDASIKKELLRKNRKNELQVSLCKSIPKLINGRADQDIFIKTIMPHIDKVFVRRYAHYRKSSDRNLIGPMFCDLMGDIGSEFTCNADDGVLVGTFCAWKNEGMEDKLYCYLCKAIMGRICRFQGFSTVIIKIPESMIINNNRCMIQVATGDPIKH